MEFFISKPCIICFYFSRPLGCVEIRLSNGIPWYRRETKDVKIEVIFNQAGRYFIDKKPVKTEKKPFAKNVFNHGLSPDRNPEFYDIKKIVKNPDLIRTPARIFHSGPKTGIVEIGPGFSSQPIQGRMFILCHEKAHLKFSNEQDADAEGLKLFCEWGGNLSQAFYALTKILHPGNVNNDRVLKMFNQVIKTTNE